MSVVGARDPCYLDGCKLDFTRLDVYTSRWWGVIYGLAKNPIKVKRCNTNVAPHPVTGIRYPDYSQEETIYGAINPRDRTIFSFDYGVVPYGVDSFITLDPLFLGDILQHPHTLMWYEVQNPREEIDPSVGDSENKSFAFRVVELHYLPFMEE